MQNFLVSDGQGGSTLGTHTISVVPLNDIPTGVVDSYTVFEGGTLSVDGLSGLLANDSDVEGDLLTATIASNPLHGVLSIGNDGSFVYTHDGSEGTSDVFTYQVSDGNGGVSTVTVNLVISVINDDPFGVNDSYVVNEGETINVGSNTGLLNNDTDSENDLLSASLLVGPNHGSLSVNSDGSFSYTHDGSETSTDAFVYQVDDGQGGTSTASVVLNVLPVNDAPTGVGESYTVDEDQALSQDVSANDFDTESSTLSYTVQDGPANAQSFNLNADGTFDYQPNAGFVGIDSFTYEVSDGAGGTGIASVTINVELVNEVPDVIGETFQLLSGENLEVTEASLLDNDIDVDGDPLIAILADPPTNGGILLAQDGTFVYEPDPGFVGVDSFTYQVNDGTANSSVVRVQISVDAAPLPIPPSPTTEFETEPDTEFASTTQQEPIDEVLDEVLETINDGENANDVENLGVPPKQTTEFLENDLEALSLEEFSAQTDQVSAVRALVKLVDFVISDSSSDDEEEQQSQKLSEVSKAYDAQMLWSQMDEIAKDILEPFDSVQFRVSLQSLTGVVAIGYVAWILRGGVLMATTLSQLPTWKMIDPLIVLDGFQSEGVVQSEGELGSYFE